MQDSSEMTPSPKKSKDQTVSAKAKHAKKPQVNETVTKAGEEMRTGITDRTRKIRTDEKIQDLKKANEEITYEKEECQQK